MAMSPLASVSLGISLLVVRCIATDPSLLLTSPLAETFTSYLGPQKYHMNATMTRYDGSWTDFCEPSSKSFNGEIVVFDVYDGGCSLQLKYLNVAASGASAIIYANPITLPGNGKYLWSWDYGKKNQDADGVVLSDVYLLDPAIAKAIDAQPVHGVVLTNDGSPTEWVVMFEGGAWIFLVRVFPFLFGVLAIGSCVVVAKWMRECNPKDVHNPIKMTVLVAEAMAWGVFGILCALNGWYASSDTLPYELAGFNGTMFAGSGFATKVAMSLCLYEVKTAMVELRPLRPIWGAFRKTIIVLAVVFILGMDVMVAFLIMINIKANNIIALFIVLVVLGQIGVAGFFFHQSGAVTKIVDAQLKTMVTDKAARREAPMYQALKRMSQMMVISGVFMLIFVIGILVLGLMLPRGPTKLFVVFFLMIVGRAGGTLSQILAMVPPKKFERKRKSSSYSSTTITSSTSDDAVETAVSQRRRSSSSVQPEG